MQFSRKIPEFVFQNPLRKIERKILSFKCDLSVIRKYERNLQKPGKIALLKYITIRKIYR
jgi:hypothetical protein